MVTGMLWLVLQRNYCVSILQISFEVPALPSCKRVKEQAWRLGSMPTEQLQPLNKSGVCTLLTEASYLINKMYKEDV